MKALSFFVVMGFITSSRHSSSIIRLTIWSLYCRGRHSTSIIWLTIWSIIRTFIWSLSCWCVNIQHQQSKIVMSEWKHFLFCCHGLHRKGCRDQRSRLREMRVNQSTFLERFVNIKTIDWYCNIRLIDHSFDHSFDINHPIDHLIHHSIIHLIVKLSGCQHSTLTIKNLCIIL